MSMVRSTYADPKSPSQQRFNDAVAIIQHRRLQDSPLKRTMADIAERYNGDFTIALPDVQGEPEFAALAASIIADSIDGSALRANDTLPSLYAPPIDPTAKNHWERAHTRRRAWSASWAESQLPLRLGRAYRQLFGYGTFCLMAIPDFSCDRAKIVTRDPMVTYPEPMSGDEVRAPHNIGFVYGRSASFLTRQYPEAANLITRFTTTTDDIWDVLEWIDEDMIQVGIMGKRQPEDFHRRYNADGTINYAMYGDGPMDQSLLLRSYPNRAGCVPGVCPSAVTLDRVVSALKRIIPATDLLNKIVALDYIASEQGVFPDRYVVAEQGGTPKIVGGHWRDGRTGQINLLEGVKTVGDLQSQPGPQTQALMSMLERNVRVSSGNPSVFQGEMSGSVRSGQTLNQLGAFSVDPRIKEAHMTMEYALKVVNEGVAAVELGYWPNKKYVVFSGWQGDNEHVEYQPSKIWQETTKNDVSYPMPGMDMTNATIALGQLNGAKFMSRKTARTKHPLIDDGDVEEQQLMVETLQDATAMAALQLVQGGTFPFTDLVKLLGEVEGGGGLVEAVAKVQAEAQARQASQAQMQPDMTGGGGMAPGAMPGVEDPNAGGQQQPPGGGEPDLVGSPRLALRQLSQALMRPPPTGEMAPSGAPPGLPAGRV